MKFDVVVLMLLGVRRLRMAWGSSSSLLGVIGGDDGRRSFLERFPLLLKLIRKLNEADITLCVCISGLELGGAFLQCSFVLISPLLDGWYGLSVHGASAPS